MTKRYKIADFLTDEQKRKACAEEYVHPKGRAPRTTSGNCPLGVAFPALPRCPTGGMVADAIVGNMVADAIPGGEPNPFGVLTSTPGSVVREIAWEFIDAWDLEKIPVEDLPVALGLAS